MSELKLTQEQLDKAPYWATRFTIRPNFVVFGNEEYAQKLFPNGNLGKIHTMSHLADIALYWKPLRGETFDINTYQFTSGDINVLHDEDGLCIEVDIERSLFAELKKCDAIALAKALGAKPADFE